MQGHWLAIRWPVVADGGSGGIEPHESSILYISWSQAVAPQLETPEAWLVEGDTAKVAQSLVEELADKLRLSSPVEAIHQEAGGAEVSFSSGE